MNTLFIIYHVLLAITFILYLIFKRNDKRLIYLGILLAVSNLIEAIVAYSINVKQPFFYWYHIFIPIDYVLLSLLFWGFQKVRWVRTLTIITIPFFIVISMWLSVFKIPPNEYPGLHSIFRGILLIVISILTLFTFNEKEKYFRVSIFWICIAVLILYSGGFFMKGFYNILLERYPAEKQYFKRLHSIISIIFNYLFYVFIIIGLVCSRAKKSLRLQ